MHYIQHYRSHCLPQPSNFFSSTAATNMLSALTTLPHCLLVLPILWMHTSTHQYRTLSKLKVVESELYCGWLLDVVAEQETRHSAQGVWTVRLSLRGSSIKSLRVHAWPLPCLLISELTILRALQPVNASPEWKQATVSEMEPIERQRSLIYPCLCQGEKWPSRCQPRLFYSQPRQLPCARHPVLKPAHFPLSCLFY